MLESRAPAAVVALAAALINYRILSEGGFFQDDFRNIGQARAGLSLHLLFLPIGATHLQPVNRFLGWVIGVPLQDSYTGSIVVVCLVLGLGTYWLVRLLDTLWGPRRTHLLIAFLFGTTPLLIGASQWIASTATSTWSVDFATGACLWFFRWLSTGSRRSYALAVVAVALAVGSWEIALATPPIITLMWLCCARRWQPVRRALLAQLPFYAIALAFMIYVELQPWHQPLTVPGIGSWLALWAVMVGRALAGSVVGTAAPSGPQTTFDLIGEVVVLVVLAGGAISLALRRRLCWSMLALFAVGTVIVSIPVATTRDSLGAAVAGTTTRYLTFLPLLLAVSVAGSLRTQLVHYRRGPKAVRPLARPATRWIALAAVIAVGVAGYLVNLSRSFDSGEYAIAMGRAGLATANRIGAGIAALGRGGQRSLVDTAVPVVIFYSVHDGSNELSYDLPYWSTAARAFGEGRAAGIDPDGLVRWASFDPGGVGPQYARVIVRATGHTTVVVRIVGVNPTEPEVPWRIQVGPGIHSFTLASWSTAIRNVSVTGRRLHVIRVQKGSVSLGTLVE